MEDRHVVQGMVGGEAVTLYGVFDGHGGKEVAIFCQEHIQNYLEEALKATNNDYKEALKKTFHKLDDQVKTEDYAD